MNIANHHTDSISNYINIVKSKENEGKNNYSQGVFSQNLNTITLKNNKGKLQQTLKKSFCENLAKEAITDSSENNIEKYITDENQHFPSKKDKSK